MNYRAFWGKHLQRSHQKNEMKRENRLRGLIRKVFRYENSLTESTEIAQRDKNEPQNQSARENEQECEGSSASSKQKELSEQYRASECPPKLVDLISEPNDEQPDGKLIKEVSSERFVTLVTNAGVRYDEPKSNPDEALKRILDGSNPIERFKELTISDLTPNVRLNHAFEHSAANSLFEFLSLGSERMRLRNYGKKSESILIESLREYLARHPLDTDELIPSNPLTNQDQVGIDHERLISALKDKDRKKNLISEKTWKTIRTELEATEHAKKLIAPIAAELDLPWPLSPKSPLSQSRISDYLGHTVTELLKINRFGHKKVSVYIACVIHLHRKQYQNETSDPQNLADTISTIWSRSRLTEREKKVLELRFGIENQRKHTLSEIKEHFRVTRERVRQIESKALHKLRMSDQYAALPDLLIHDKERIWDLLTETDRLKKQEWMEPLEDKLGFEYQMALEVVDERKHRSMNMSALAYWLDKHFTSDETYWYRHADKQTTEPENQNRINGSLMDFLDEL